FVAEMWRMYKFFAPKDGDDDDDGPGGQSGDVPPGTKFGATKRMPDGPEGDIERGPYDDDDDRRDNDDIERGGGDPERRGGDDIERPGEADDRPFTGGSPFGGLPGDGLSREELDEILREIEGLTKVEREELDRELGIKPDGSPVDDKAGTQDAQPP